MVKSGIIVGVIMIVLALGSSLISPICSICVALLTGLAAGYLANVFDKPLSSDNAMARGAGAGAIAGGIAIIGQLIGAVLNATFVDADVINQFLGQPALTDETLWFVQLGTALCVGLFNVAIMAGLGVLGAMIWRQMRGNTQAPNPPGYSQP